MCYGLRANALRVVRVGVRQHVPMPRPIHPQEAVFPRAVQPRPATVVMFREEIIVFQHLKSKFTKRSIHTNVSTTCVPQVQCSKPPVATSTISHSASLFNQAVVRITAVVTLHGPSGAGARRRDQVQARYSVPLGCRKGDGLLQPTPRPVLSSGGPLIS